jgi:hypothetical protein
MEMAKIILDNSLIDTSFKFSYVNLEPDSEISGYFKNKFKAKF